MRRILLVMLLVFLFVSEKGQADVKRSGEGKAFDMQQLVYAPESYFPKPETELTYEIRLGDVDPIALEKVVWPTDKGNVVPLVRYRPYFTDEKKIQEAPNPKEATWPVEADEKPSKKTFLLKLKTKKPVVKKEGNTFLTSVELTIEQDDFYVYADVKKLFWSVENQDGRFAWRETVVYSPKVTIAPFGCKEEGRSNSLLFFDGIPGDQLLIDTVSNDKLTFMGIDSIPMTSTTGLHFVKTVEPQKGDGSKDKYANKGFKEHTYFAVGKGPVYGRQVVDGKNSITWRLVDSK